MKIDEETGSDEDNPASSLLHDHRLKMKVLNHKDVQGGTQAIELLPEEFEESPHIDERSPTWKIVQHISWHRERFDISTLSRLNRADDT